MTNTYILSDNHEVDLTKKDDGTVDAVSRWRTSANYWSYCFKTFDCIEDAITFYKIAF